MGVYYRCLKIYTTYKKALIPSATPVIVHNIKTFKPLFNYGYLLQDFHINGQYRNTYINPHLKAYAVG